MAKKLRFGIYCDVQNMPEVEESAQIWGLMGLIQNADRNGYDYFCVIEHHFFPTFSICTNPLALWSAAAQVTESIRFRTVCHTLPLHNPLILAGEIAMADILTSVDQIDAVYSMDDETSIGALQAIREANRTDIQVITGGGGMQEYFRMMPENEDIWIQSALYSPAMVRDAVDMAVDILNGEDVEDTIIIPTTIVDRTNYQDFLDEGSPY